MPEVLRDALWVERSGLAARGRCGGAAVDGAVAVGALVPPATSPTVRLCTRTLSFGLIFSPEPLSTVGSLLILVRTSNPPVTVPTIEYDGAVVGVKSLKKIRNWLPLLPGGVPMSATVPFG